MNETDQQESAKEFMLRKARDFNEWKIIGDPRTMARIRECVKRYPSQQARSALREACMSIDHTGCTKNKRYRQG